MKRVWTFALRPSLFTISNWSAFTSMATSADVMNMFDGDEEPCTSLQIELTRLQDAARGHGLNTVSSLAKTTESN